MTIQKMDKKWKKKWVEALRSGEYRQGQNMLRNNNKFCCLGVLCDLYEPTKWSGESYKTKYMYNYITYLPAEVREKTNLSIELERKLAKYNDLGKSFKWIASYIERYM